MKSGPSSSQSGKERVASSPAAGSQSSHLSWQCYRASIFHRNKSSSGVCPVGMAKVSSSFVDLSSPKPVFWHTVGTDIVKNEVRHCQMFTLSLSSKYSQNLNCNFMLPVGRHWLWACTLLLYHHYL